MLHKKFQVISSKIEGVMAIFVRCVFDKNIVNFSKIVAISRYLEAKFDYGYFIIFLHYGSTILHKKFQVISIKNEGVTAIFVFFYFFYFCFKVWTL